MRPISRPTASDRSIRSTGRGSELGFSLVELMVVVALMGLIAAMAIPSLSNVFKISLGSATRDLATTVRYAYNAAMMTKKVHRLVYDIDHQRYWVEVGPQNLLMDTEETRAKAERARKFGSKLTEEEEKKLKASEPSFSLATYVTRKKTDLARGVEFVDVKTEAAKEPVKDGLVYTHFFPHGIIEQTVIHLKDNSNHQSTLIIAPTVGRTRVIERFVPIEEALLQP